MSLLLAFLYLILNILMVVGVVSLGLILPFAAIIGAAKLTDRVSVAAPSRPRESSEPTYLEGSESDDDPYPVIEPRTCAVCEKPLEDDDEVYKHDEMVAHRDCWMPPLTAEHLEAVAQASAKRESLDRNALVELAFEAWEHTPDRVELLCRRVLATNSESDREKLAELMHTDETLSEDICTIIAAVLASEQVGTLILRGLLATADLYEPLDSLRS